MNTVSTDDLNSSIWNELTILDFDWDGLIGEYIYIKKIIIIITQIDKYNIAKIQMKEMVLCILGSLKVHNNRNKILSSLYK